MMNKIIVSNADSQVLRRPYVVHDSGDVYDLISMTEMRPRTPTNKIQTIYLYKMDGSTKLIQKDKLVATAFMPEWNGRVKIYHKDGDLTNCNISNLYVKSGIDRLRYLYNETKQWKLVQIPDTTLYFEYWICEDGRLYNATTDSFVKPFKDLREKNKGYLRYNLYIGKGYRNVIHHGAARLVAYAFLPHIEGKDIVLYKDGNPSNIDASNLQFGDAWDAQTKYTLNKGDTRELTKLKNPILGKEKWKILDDWIISPDKLLDEYLVSSFGRVYNNDKKFYVMAHFDSLPNKNNQHHITIQLHVSVNGKSRFKTYGLHRLIASAFCKGYSEERCHVNHINGNPECNLSINLEWVTPQENMLHAIDTNLIRNFAYTVDRTNSDWMVRNIIAWVLAYSDSNIDVSYPIYRYMIQSFWKDVEIMSYDKYVTYINHHSAHDDNFKCLYTYYMNHSNKQ